MDLIRFATRRSTVGEVGHILLNLAYAGVLLLLVLVFNPPWLAYLAVVLSKWRVFAVRPRYWFANLQANLIDAFVAASFVTLLWLAAGNLVLQLVLAGLLAVWLIVIKPRTKRNWVLSQSLICQALSLTALFSLAYNSIALVVVAVSWLIGYVSARHAISAYNEESERTLLSLIWGLVVAELSWLAYHWTIAYTIVGQVKVPEMVLIVSLLGFLAISAYEVIRSERQHWARRLRWPASFVVFVLLTLLVLFNGLNTASL